MTVEAPTEMFAGGSLQVSDPASGLQRSAVGVWHLRALQRGEPFDVTVSLPSERYVAAVLQAEAAPEEPRESLQALAVLARTYALNGAHYSSRPGHLKADLCDSTACQAVRFGPVSRAVESAVRSTAGEALWFHSVRAQVFFSQHCGGVTEDAKAAWPGLVGAPYLITHADPYCSRLGPAAWHAEILESDLEKIARQEHWPLQGPLASAFVSRRSSSGRAILVTLISTHGRAVLVAGPDLRLAIGRALGWNLVRSDLYQLSLQKGRLTFDGKGHGHGVGLCQVGAAEMARVGKKAREILAFYLPGTQVGVSPFDDGWQDISVGPLTVRKVGPLTPELTRTVLEAWRLSGERFPGSQPTQPLIVFAPSTELFRQLTAQPGWSLASTSGATTVLQPASAFSRNNVTLASVLLHELLHLRVEGEATSKAPLWLREGLVEALAGEGTSLRRPLRLDVLNDALSRPATGALARSAHAQAASAVEALIRQYGLDTTRKWLRAGVPPEVQEGLQHNQ